MKPVNKQEGRWYWWRSETFYNPKKGFARFAKKQMVRARRNFFKKAAREEEGGGDGCT